MAKKTRQHKSKLTHGRFKDKRQNKHKFKAKNATVNNKTQNKAHHAKTNTKHAGRNDSKKDSKKETNEKTLLDLTLPKHMRTDKRRQNPRYQQKYAKKDDELDFEEIGQDLTVSEPTDSFPTRDSESDNEEQDTRKLVQQQNRKKKKSGGFQSMGLSHNVYKGVIRKGYKIPTPIQRKTIPLIMDGKDVVAMARTGSGKTASFLIPMFERLKTHLTSGARAIILSPTRELALQTLKFAKELGRFSGLKSAVVLGGDRMDEQFSALHENPDIIIATPGRFMHVLVEMELKLTAVEYLVFDEADRLFEMGFAEHMREILLRVPENRQTVLFSATLPKLLVDFAKAGLNDPTLIRLDVDSKLSEHLKVAFLQCRSDNKLAVLIHLLRNVIKPSEQTVIFVATKHHAEYLNLVLLETGFTCSYTYSSLDQTARKINVAKFRNKKTMILIVTDLAARGIDIPLLDNVINYNFPAKPKLFVHRVGRVARAGRSGTAYSLIAPDEVAFVLDLHLFLGRPLKPVTTTTKYTDQDECLYGQVPQTVIDDEEENLRLLGQKHDIKTLEKVTINSYKAYIKTRPAASSESVKRIRELVNDNLSYHPMFGGAVTKDLEAERDRLLQSMKTYKAKGTIFEVNAKRQTDAYNVMKTKRLHHENVIERSLQNKAIMVDQPVVQSSACEISDEANIQEVFSRVIVSKPPNDSMIYDPDHKKKKKNLLIRDEENYLHYRPKDFQSEKGLNLTSFDKEAGNAMLEITGDDDVHIRQQRGHTTWDRKRKKYVSEKGFDPGHKKIKTESGQWISATYKKNIYKEWLDKSKVADPSDDSENEQRAHIGKSKTSKKMQVLGGKRNRRGSHKEGKLPPAAKKKFHGGRKELQNKDQILKQRRKKEKLESFMKSREKKKNRHRPS